MLKRFLKIGSILLLGAAGGLLFQIIILPYLFTNPYFERFQFIKTLKEREVIVNPKEEIIIRENLALELAVERVQNSVIGIQVRTSAGRKLEGSGLILTSDGLAVTLDELAPSGSKFSFFVDKEKISGQILKRDVKNNLALIKIEKANLPTHGFANLERIKLGQRVFLLGVVFNTKNEPFKSVNEGIVKNFSEQSIQTNIVENNIIKGSPLFDIEGNILGLSIIDREGQVSAIPADIIKTFSGF